VSSDATICAGIGFIVFLVMGMAFLLRSLNLQVGHSPTPTGNPDQHVGLGCGAVLLFLLGVVLILGTKEGWF
jgi:hypothetical protein